MIATPGAVAVGERLIRRFEGCRLHAYRDVRGLWTIGWGNRTLLNGAPVLSSTPPLTQAAADALQEQTLRRNVLPRLDSLVERPLNDNQAGALMSLAWNIGTAGLSHSQVIGCINKGLLQAAVLHFLDWDHVAGVPNAALLARRKAERAVWNTAVAVPAVQAAA